MAAEADTAPIKSKVVFVKILFLRDKEKFKDQPVFTRRLRGSARLESVYDSALFYIFTLFGAKRPNRYEWKFTSTDGTVDDVLQLYPFDASKFHADRSKDNLNKYYDGIIIPKTDSALVIAHHYNAFQREKGEWALARAEKDISELRLVVDFSSVITASNEDLFIEQPDAYFIDPIEKTTKFVDLEYNTGKIFSVSKKNVSEGCTLELRWKMNWDSLATWQGFRENKRITPEISNVVPNISYNKTYNIRDSQIQQNSPYSIQTQTISDNKLQELEQIIEELKGIAERLQIPQQQKDVKAEIKTIEGQLSSSKPKIKVITESLSDIRSILEGVSGTVIATAPIIAKITSWL
jgi:hypothetical protein